MKPLTVKDLLEECKKQIANGRGNDVIMLSDDDEGNGYHYCWYAFTTAKELLDDDEISTLDYCIDEEVAPTSKTIILG